MTLSRAFFAAGGREYVTVFLVRCATCGAEERGGARLPDDKNPETSHAAKRMREKCDPEAHLVCRFERICCVEQLDRPGALALGLSSVPEEPIGAAPGGPTFNLAQMGELAAAAFDTLGPEE